MYIDAKSSFTFVPSTGVREMTAAVATFHTTPVVFTNVIDLGAPGAFYSGVFYVYVKAIGTGANSIATSTKVFFDLYTDSAENLSSKSLVAVSNEVPVSVLNALTASTPGKIVAIIPVNGQSLKRYIALYSRADAIATGTVNMKLEAGIAEDFRLNSFVSGNVPFAGT